MKNGARNGAIVGGISLSLYLGLLSQGLRCERVLYAMLMSVVAAALIPVGAGVGYGIADGGGQLPAGALSDAIIVPIGTVFAIRGLSPGQGDLSIAGKLRVPLGRAVWVERVLPNRRTIAGEFGLEHFVGRWRPAWCGVGRRRGRADWREVVRAHRRSQRYAGRVTAASASSLGSF